MIMIYIVLVRVLLEKKGQYCKHRFALLEGDITNAVDYSEVEAKTITATQIAEILGVSVQKIGIISNKYNLKTEQNGYWVHEKAKYCNKEIPNFRYFESAIEEFRKYV